MAHSIALRSREEILASLAAYNDAVRQRAICQRDVDDLFDKVVAMVPHSGFSDLYFYGEVERSDEEMVDEALARERIWMNEGELALLLHIYNQAGDAIENPASPALYKNNAIDTQRDVMKRVEELKAGGTH